MARSAAGDLRLTDDGRSRHERRYDDRTFRGHHPHHARRLCRRVDGRRRHRHDRLRPGRDLLDRRGPAGIVGPRLLPPRLGPAGRFRGGPAGDRRCAPDAATVGAADLEVHRRRDRDLQHRQPDRRIPADRRPDAVPVAGGPLLPRVLSGPVHRIHDCRARELAARILGAPAARLADTGAGLRHILLVLRDQPGGRGKRRGVRALRAGPGVHRLRLPDADGDRRAAHEQLALPAAAHDARVADRRVRDDVPRRHRLGDCGRREFVLLRRELLGRPVPRLLRRPRRGGAGADPRQVAAGAPARRGRRHADPGRRLRGSRPVLLRARVLRGWRRQGHGDDHDRGHLRARRAGHGPAERDPA